MDYTILDSIQKKKTLYGFEVDVITEAKAKMFSENLNKMMRQFFKIPKWLKSKKLISVYLKIFSCEIKMFPEKKLIEYFKKGKKVGEVKFEI